MAKNKLAVELRSPRESYRSGDTIDVIVHVDAEAEVQCKALTLNLGWATHGKGNRDKAVDSSESIYAGAIPAGHSQYEGSVVVPNLSSKLPSTYNGHFLNIDWFVSAAADIPWAFDPKDEVRVYVEASESEQETPPVQWTAEPVKMRGHFAGWMFLAVLLIAAAIFVGLKNMGIAVIIALPAAYALMRCAGERSQQKALGVVEFGAWPPKAEAGMTVMALAKITPPSDVLIEKASVKLRLTESATSGSGTDKTTHRHVAWEVEETVAEDERIRAGESFVNEVPIETPRDLPPTFSAASNTLDWTIEFMVHRSGAKPLTHSTSIQMRAPHGSR